MSKGGRMSRQGLRTQMLTYFRSNLIAGPEVTAVIDGVAHFTHALNDALDMNLEMNGKPFTTIRDASMHFCDLDVKKEKLESTLVYEHVKSPFGLDVRCHFEPIADYVQNRYVVFCADMINDSRMFGTYGTSLFEEVFAPALNHPFVNFNYCSEREIRLTTCWRFNAPTPQTIDAIVEKFTLFHQLCNPNMDYDRLLAPYHRKAAKAIIEAARKEVKR
jgi:hypothetical protein